VLKKRLVGVVTVRQGWAVQSFGYRRYLPLGRPEVLVENLDRWGADEILVCCIDRAETGLGPDLELLERISALGLSTPIIYGGGVKTGVDAVSAVSNGADRILLDSLLWDSPNELELLSRELGNQALIAHLPVSVRGNVLYWKNYRNGKERLLDCAALSGIPLEWISEVMLTDYIHEGLPRKFDEEIATLFPLQDMPLVLFGGISEACQIQRILTIKNVAAIGVGNFLNYKEHAFQRIKQNLVVAPIRAAHFAAEEC